MNDHSLNKILLGKNALCLVIEGCPSLEPTCLLPPPCPFPEGLEPVLSVLLLGENGRGEGFLGGSNGKEPACNVGDLSLIPGWEDPLEKDMATHSSILAWRIPWMEEPAGLQSTGSQRVRHD